MGIIKEWFDKKVEQKRQMELLNPFNLETLTKKEIRTLGRGFSEESWDLHKRKVILQWMKMQDNFNTKQQVKAKKLIKKLEITIDEEIEDVLFSLERREFTTRRAFKQIELPFSKEEGYENKSAIWYFRDIKLYDNARSWMKELTDNDLYVLKDSLVWWDKNKEEIAYVIESDELQDLVKQDFGIQLNTITKRYVLRYVDNEVLFIALKRVYRKQIEKDHVENRTREFQLHEELKKAS